MLDALAFAFVAAALAFPALGLVLMFGALDVY
jgi:hypothetical protein